MQLRQNIYTHTLALRSIMVNLPLRLAVHLAVEMTALPVPHHQGFMACELCEVHFDPAHLSSLKVISKATNLMEHCI